MKKVMITTLDGYEIPKEYMWGGPNCFWCGREVIYNVSPRVPHVRVSKKLRAQEQCTATREHLIPRAHGGKHENNIVVACKRCNNRRGIQIDWRPHSMTPAAKAFLKFVRTGVSKHG